MSNVCIQGLGFVGSAMAVAIASKLKNNNEPMFNVNGIDLNTKESKHRINSINSGKFPFISNDKKLEKKLLEAVQRGNLFASSETDYYKSANVILISINCDLSKDIDKLSIDFDPFILGIKTVAKFAKEGALIIIESTIPPGTTEKIILPIFKKSYKYRGLNPDNIFIAYSYERVMPGKNYFDSITNYWRVYAGINDKSAIKCKEFLSKIINTSDFPLTKLKNTTSCETAKVLENSYRAVNIAFMEEWSRFAEDVGIDLFEVIDAVKKRPTHNNIMKPGFGVGGYCLTKDPLFAKISARDIFKIDGHDFLFCSNAIKINKNMPNITFEKIYQYFNSDLSEKIFLLMGCTYKADVGDTRFSPSEYLAKKILASGAEIDVYDPMVTTWDEMKQLKLLSAIPEPKKYDAIIFTVNHNQFAKINLSEWLSNCDLLLFDSNDVLTEDQRASIQNQESKYLSIGRAK